MQESASPSNVQSQLAGLRPALVKFARMQLRNDAVADDVVSETIVAILERPGAFAAQSSLRTYATGVLKHKIVDHLRRSGREVHIEAEDGDSEAMIDALFVADGHWRHHPGGWGDPQAAFERQEFFEVLQSCSDYLPPNLARMFMMREWLELDTDEICRELGITTNHCFVLLFRARMRLRECLQRTWFGAAT